MAERLKVGVALGSGAARGLAHIGVLSVLKENNIPIDFIAGTSVGAIVGAYYALNEEINPFEKKISKMGKNDFFKLVDLSSKAGLIKGDKIKKFLEEIYNNASFKDTKIPLRMIATDISSGKEVVIDSGKLCEGARASISIPGIFVPVEIDGKILVDGGIVNSTPIDVVRDMGADIVIGIDLPVAKLEKGNKLSMVSVIMQSFEIMRERLNKIEEDERTIIITPNISEGITGHQFYNADYIEEGKKAAREAIPRIKKMIKVSEI